LSLKPLDGIFAHHNGAFLANSPEISVNAKAKSVFGINSESVLGQFITTIGHLAIAPIALLFNPTDTSIWESLNVFDGGLWRAPTAAFNGVLYAIANNGFIESTKYKKFLSNITLYTWSEDPNFVISDARSALIGTQQSPVLKVAFVTTTKPKYKMSYIQEDIKREIDVLKSFSQDAKQVLVRPGQNFWNLSNQIYGTPYYYHMLASANGIDRGQSYRLRAGKTIVAPPLYQLPLDPKVHFMKPGETIYGLCVERFNVPVGKCMSAIAQANPNLSMSHLYALESIQLPALPTR
jgi:hypothetical protein